MPNSGDLSDTNYYRKISLSSIVSKIFIIMFLNRFRDTHFRINQNRFRPGRSTVSQTLALRRIIEGVKAKKLPAIITFINVKKAFDPIHRERMI